MTGTTRTARAVVIGSSIGGLLAARVLGETYREVVLVDRDELPGGPVTRPGVPQARHSHAVLARGREILEELFPGLTDELVAQGAGSGDVQQGTLLYAGPRPMARGFSGLRSIAVSRPRLEWAVRERVAALPGVTFLERTSVLDLVFASGENPRVVGVLVGSVDGPDTSRRLDADLVVDASGRNARTPEWLERGGYAASAEERVRIDAAYVTRRFRRISDREAHGARAILHVPVPGIPRTGVMLYQEDGAWTVSLCGYAGVRPPTDLDGFLAYARSLCSPVIADTIQGLEPLGDPVTYRFPANVRRRYERLGRFPDGLLVTGDALCAFDPTYGQGMSVAAIEAMLLRRCLRDGRHGLAARFFAQAAAQLDAPWSISVGGSAQAAGFDLEQRPLERLVGRYLAALRRSTVDDAVLAGAFMHVTNLAAPLSSLLRPRFLVRVLRAQLTRRWRHRVTDDPRAGTRPHTPPDRRGPAGQHHTMGQRT